MNSVLGGEVLLGLIKNTSIFKDNNYNFTPNIKNLIKTHILFYGQNKSPHI